jgi:hypothetical protein
MLFLFNAIHSSSLEKYGQNRYETDIGTKSMRVNTEMSG